LPDLHACRAPSRDRSHAKGARRSTHPSLMRPSLHRQPLMRGGLRRTAGVLLSALSTSADDDAEMLVRQEEQVPASHGHGTPV
jgi:hypothetical protein